MEYRAFLERQLKNPEVRKKYEALGLKYTIVGGVNGVGKTTFIREHKEMHPSSGEIIDADQITADLGGDPLTGGKAALKKIRKCLRKRVSFLQETTLSGYKTNATAKKAREQGYTVHLIYIGLGTVEESLRRIENRVREGGHDIPREDVIRRFQRRWEAVSQILPYCREAEFYDNEEEFVKVAEYRDGEFLRIGNHVCAWVDELAEYLDT